MRLYELFIEEIDKGGIIQSSNLTVKEIAVGIFYTGVKLSDGSLGISFTEISELTQQKYRDRIMEDIPCLHLLHKEPLEKLMKLAFSPIPLEFTIGSAVINSLSHSLFRRNRENLNILETDCLSLLNIKENDEVTMIGALPSYIRKIKGVAKKLTVIDNNPGINECEGHPVTRGEHTYNAVKTSDVLIMTGVTFTNGSVDYLTDLAPPQCRCAIVGPSAGTYPVPYFRKGISILGTMEITDSDAVLAVIRHGGSIRHFRNFSKKITIAQNLP